MLRLHGVSPPSQVILYRIGIAVLLLMLLHSYSSHRSQMDVVIRTAKNDIEQCKANSESIFSKLKVIFEHKKKMELLQQVQRNDSERKISEIRKSIVNCHSELDKAKERISSLENVTLKAEKLKTSPEEELQLQKDELDRLKKKLEEQDIELRKRQNLVETVRKELDDCQRMVKQHVGALPVAHYTQNETAFFNRKHKAGDELSFDRGAIEEHRGNVVPGAVLMERLKEKKKKKEEAEEEEEVHPEDRKEEDDYVNEQPDAAEADYKEHH